MERNEVRAIEKLRAMRDQIRLEVHLGGMEAKDRWVELEKRIHAAEHGAKVKLNELVADVKLFKEALKS